MIHKIRMKVIIYGILILTLVNRRLYEDCAKEKTDNVKGQAQDLVHEVLNQY